MSKISPIGTSATAAAKRRANNPAYRREQERLARCEHIARQIIRYRMDKRLSQQQLANLVGTSNTAISRLESGQHDVSVRTLGRVAEALDLNLEIGFTEKRQLAHA